MNDPYRILGVAPTATDDEVKRAYKTLAKKYHPDLNPGNANAEAMMKQVNSAYDEIMAIRSGKKVYQEQQSSSYGGAQYNPYGQSYGNYTSGTYDSYGRTYRSSRYQEDYGDDPFTWDIPTQTNNSGRRYGRVVMFPGLKIFFIIIMLQMFLSFVLRGCAALVGSIGRYPVRETRITSQYQYFEEEGKI